ncbi:unnamed protein product [Lupinus luteus]|uniref:Uncharacterized protein n=1 Tax=Lupinus luteus TaxID=3873 RepID=A0AAV1XRM1_LUPLU
MAATTSSSSCNGIFSFRSNHSQDSPGCGKLDVVAMWFINGVTKAFFASTELCSCTQIPIVEDGEDAHHLPLIINDGNLRHCDDGGEATNNRRRTMKRKKSGAPSIFSRY